MNVHQTYIDFNEAEDNIKKYAPPVIYKYRTWKDENHKHLLTHQEAWFAHPFTLNDPHDVRRPYKINVTGYQTGLMLAKLWEQGRRIHPTFRYFELAPEVRARWRQIQADPIKYFQDNIDEVYNDKELFGRMGVFSTSYDELSIPMWNSDEYSDNNKGYCMGFDTVELAKGIQVFIGKTKYTDEEIEYKVIDGLTEEQSREEVLMKYPKWAHEKEFRFMTFNIQNEQDRLKIFPIRAVKEILIGHSATIDTEQQIIEKTRQIYGPDVPIYRVVLNGDGTLGKKQLNV